MVINFTTSDLQVTEHSKLAQTMQAWSQANKATQPIGKHNPQWINPMVLLARDTVSMITLSMSLVTIGLLSVSASVIVFSDSFDKLGIATS